MKRNSEYGVFFLITLLSYCSAESHLVRKGVNNILFVSLLTQAPSFLKNGSIQFIRDDVVEIDPPLYIRKSKYSVHEELYCLAFSKFSTTVCNVFIWSDPPHIRVSTPLECSLGSFHINHQIHFRCIHTVHYNFKEALRVRKNSDCYFITHIVSHIMM